MNYQVQLKRPMVVDNGVPFPHSYSAVIDEIMEGALERLQVLGVEVITSVILQDVGDADGMSVCSNVRILRSMH